MTLADERISTSAGAKAEQLKHQAEKLLKRAEAWEKGARGEEATAALLARLTGTGWWVRNDLRLPNSKANVDHLVIGPGGVLVIDTKNYSGKVTVGRSLIWQNGRSRRREMDTARRHTALLSSALQLDPGVPVRTVLVIQGATMAAGQFEVGGITVLSPKRLLSWVVGLPRCWPASEVASVLSRVDSTVQSYLPESLSGPDTDGSPRPQSPTATALPVASEADEEKPDIHSARPTERTPIRSYPLTDVRDDILGRLSPGRRAVDRISGLWPGSHRWGR